MCKRRVSFRLCRMYGRSEEGVGVGDQPYGTYFTKKQDQERRARDGQRVETKTGEMAECRKQPAAHPVLRSQNGVLVDASASPHTQQQ